MLSGCYQNTLDEKGRILFPAKLKCEIFGNSIFATQGLDGCIWIFSKEEWQNFSEKIMQNASIFSAKSRSVLRRIIAPTQEIEFDKAGRLSIPQTLREFATLSKNCVFLGLNHYVELWDAQNYEDYLKESEKDFSGATEELSQIYF